MIGFFIGIITGTMFGAMIMSLMVAASQTDKSSFKKH